MLEVNNGSELAQERPLL